MAYELMRPNEWLSNILSHMLTNLSMYAKSSDFESCLTKIELSNDPDIVFSAIIEIFYCTNQNNKIIESYPDNASIRSTIRELSNERWVELFEMGPMITRECIRLFTILDEPPLELLDNIGSYMNADMERELVNVWLHMKWSLSPELAYVAQSSDNIWKFICQYSDGITSSAKFMANVSKSSDPNIWMTICILLNTNKFVLEYFISLDDNIEKTVSTINDIDLVETTIANPAAAPIVDFILANPKYCSRSQGLSQNEFRLWIIYKMDSSPLVNKYVELNDITEDLLDDFYYSNPHAIDRISEWVARYGMKNSILRGLVMLSSCNNYKYATRALNLLRDYVDKYKSEDWVTLLIGPYSRSFALEHIEKDKLRQYLYITHLLPTWSRGWQLDNLNTTTVRLIRYDHMLKNMIITNAAQLSNENWDMLLTTRFGIRLALRHVHLMMMIGKFEKILESPLLTHQEISSIPIYYIKHYIGSLISRDDALAFDLKKCFTTRHELCLSILQAWYEPDRLCRVASNNNMSIREFLIQGNQV